MPPLGQFYQGARQGQPMFRQPQQGMGQGMPQQGQQMFRPMPQQAQGVPQRPMAPQGTPQMAPQRPMMPPQGGGQGRPQMMPQWPMGPPQGMPQQGQMDPRVLAALMGRR